MKLQIVWEDITDEGGFVDISDERYAELCKRYGIYGFDWYFVGSNRIKFFDGKKWNYENL